MTNNMTNVTFSSVDLKMVEFKKSKEIAIKSYQIVIEDEINLVSFDKTSFVLEYCRKTKNKDPFYVRTVFEFTVYFDEVGIAFYNGDLERIKRFAELRKSEIVTNLNLPQRASLLIGNIVREIGAPFISIPIIVENSKK